MAVAFVDATSGSNSAGGTSHVLSRPGSTATGNLLIATIALAEDVAITAPAGWRPFAGFGETPGNDSSQQKWWRIAAGGDPSTWTFTTASSLRSVFGISAWSGHDPDRPIDAIDCKWGNNVDVICPDLTAKRSGVLVCEGSLATGISNTLAAPGGFTSLHAWTTTSAISMLAAYKAVNAGGAGGANFGTPGNFDWLGSSYLINEDYTPATLGSSAFAAAVMALGPAGYWRLADEVGLTADDWAGSNDGSYVNAAFGYGPPIFPALPGSLQLGGASVRASQGGNTTPPFPHVALPSVNWWSSTPDVYSILCCFKLVDADSGMGAGSGRATIFGASGTAGKPQIEIEADGSLDMIVEGAFRWDSAAGTITDGTPYFLVFTRNGSGNTFAVYLNGSTITDASPSTTSQTSGAFAGVIGVRTPGSASGSQPFVGFISDVALFTSALTSGQVAALYALLNSTPAAGEPRFSVPQLIG